MPPDEKPETDDSLEQLREAAELLPTSALIDILDARCRSFVIAYTLDDPEIKGTPSTWARMNGIMAEAVGLARIITRGTELWMENWEARAILYDDDDTDESWKTA